jgi:hypothetical protein
LGDPPADSLGRLGPEALLDLADLLLRASDDLVDVSLGLEAGVADRLGGDDLEFADDLLGSALDFVLVARLDFKLRLILHSRPL